MFNVWASWCVSCREEHPVLMDMARRKLVPIYGLDYKDQRADGIRWLKQFGDPYVLSAFDATGKVGIDYGVYGVPETYVIDKRGVIRRIVGPVSHAMLDRELLPLLRALDKP